MSSTTNDMCRLTVVAPSGWAEVALPAHVPLATLVPVLVRNAGPQLAEQGIERGGWVVQRLGEPPLDEDRSPSALGLRDGDTLYLRSRQEELPPFDFDDLIDGVATGIEKRADRWQDTMTRRLFLGLQVVALVAGLVTLLLGGDPMTRGIAALSAAMLLLIGGTAAARAFGDGVAGALLGGSSLPYTGLGCLLVLPGEPLLTAPHVMTAGAGVAAVATLARLLVADARPFFVAATALGLFGAVGGLLATTTSMGSGGAAAVASALALSLAPAAPSTAFRLGGLRVPALPTGRADLQDNLDPVAGDMLMARTVAVDNYLTALFTVIGSVCAAALTIVLLRGGWEPPVFSGVVCALLLLRTRILISAWQRIAMTAPAVYGLLLLLLGWARALPVDVRVEAVLTTVIVIAGLLGLAARKLPGARLLPYWGRAAELLESLFAISVLPLALAVTGFYAYARSLGS